MTNHLKRIAAPKTWNINRKDRTFIIKPNFKIIVIFLLATQLNFQSTQACFWSCKFTSAVDEQATIHRIQEIDS